MRTPLLQSFAEQLKSPKPRKTTKYDCILKQSDPLYLLLWAEVEGGAKGTTQHRKPHDTTTCDTQGLPACQPQTSEPMRKPLAWTEDAIDTRLCWQARREPKPSKQK